jgi:hypothetical protein
MAPALTNANKNRHKTIIRAILGKALRDAQGIEKLNLKTGDPMSGPKLMMSPFGRIGKRLGNERSADGFVFDLPDITAPSGDKVVLKVIFSTDDDPSSEVSIGTYCGLRGIGPKVFAAYRLKSVSGQNMYNLARNKGALLGNQVNLFANYNIPKAPGSTSTYGPGNIRYKSFDYIYLIVMENAYVNPVQHVVAAETLKKAMRDPNFHIPFARINALRSKMMAAGIVHADLHEGNIIIQKIQKPGKDAYFRPLIIDFGRSFRVPRSFATNANVNAFLIGTLKGRPLNQAGYERTHLSTRLGAVFKETAVTNYLKRYEAMRASTGGSANARARVATRSPSSRKSKGRP